MVEFPEIKSLTLVKAPGVKDVVEVSGTYVIESEEGVTHEGAVFYVKNPVITIYKGDVEVKSFRLNGSWNGRVYWVNDKAHLLLKKE